MLLCTMLCRHWDSRCQPAFILWQIFLRVRMEELEVVMTWHCDTPTDLRFSRGRIQKSAHLSEGWFYSFNSNIVMFSNIMTPDYDFNFEIIQSLWYGSPGDISQGIEGCYVRPWSLNLLFCRRGFGLVVSAVVPSMLAVLPYARGRGFDARSSRLSDIYISDWNGE
jgi:hypothetical protein